MSATATASDETTLYRLYDSAGQLLYVGIARAWTRRMRQHERSQPWWGEVANVSTQEFATRGDASEAEKKAIRSESPKYNVVHQSSGAETMAGRPLRWRCEHCRKPIEPLSRGYLQCSYSEIDRYRLEVKRWEERLTLENGGKPWMTGSQLMNRPHRASWEIACRDCDTLKEGMGYWLTLDRAASWVDLAGWTAHFMGKDWFADTDFDRVLRKLIAWNE